MPAAGTRARVRAELTREITDIARTHLASAGAAALSLRAVAREMGMASSAIYRYFPSRDDLLTTLIVDAYDAIGAAAEEAEQAVPRDDLITRWHAATDATRTWAKAHPHEYALVYGSPVPGYVAPQTTVGPAGRVALILSSIIAEVDAGHDDADAALEPGVAEQMGLTSAARGVFAWSALFGMISFELFGHTHNVVADHERFFRAGADRLAVIVGLRP